MTKASKMYKGIKDAIDGNGARKFARNIYTDTMAG